MDMAVGIIIGAAFTAIVTSMVADLINPIIGLIIGGIDFSNMYAVLSGEVPAGASLDAAREAGAAVFAYGAFINAVINFLIIAFVVFMLVRYVNKVKDAAMQEGRGGAGRARRSDRDRPAHRDPRRAREITSARIGQCRGLRRRGPPVVRSDAWSGLVAKRGGRHAAAAFSLPRSPRPSPSARAAHAETLIVNCTGRRVAQPAHRAGHAATRSSARWPTARRSKPWNKPAPGCGCATSPAPSAGRRRKYLRRPQIDSGGSGLGCRPGDGCLNLRTGPGTNYQIIMPMYNGEMVEILAACGNWRRVRHKTAPSAGPCQATS